MHSEPLTKTERNIAAEALWRRWNKDSDLAARNRLLLSYAPMVKYLAHRQHRQLPSHIDLEDLISAGLVALISAIDRFDPDTGVAFESYAWLRVRGAILDELRRQDWTPRSVRRSERAIKLACDQWLADTGRPATRNELAKQLGIDLPELDHQMQDIARADMRSLQETVEHASEAIELGDTLPTTHGEHDPELRLLGSERNEVFRSAFTTLTQRERSALVLRHLHGLSGTEIGSLLAMSESRVSQVLTAARLKLQAAVESYEREGRLRAMMLRSLGNAA